MRRLGSKKRAPDRAGADTARERVSSSASLLRPDSRIAASSYNEEGTKVSTDVSQARSRDPSPMPVGESRRDDPQRKEADIDEKNGGRKDSRLDPDVGVAAGSGPRREDKRAHPPLPVTPISPEQGPDGRQMLSPQLLHLIIPLHDVTMQRPPQFPITCRKRSFPTRTLNRMPPRTGRNRVGSLPPMLPLNYSSAE